MLAMLKSAAWALGMKAREFCTKEDGDVNIVSIVVLIGIAVALAVIFRRQVGDLINSLFSTINTHAQNAIGG